MSSSDTLTRADISEAVYNRLGLSMSESGDLVEAIIEEISDALVEEGEVKISRFASFYVREKDARIGRNPKTLEEVTIPARKVISFRPSQILKDHVNHRNDEEQDAA
jgi:integration host factor subunit alpha